MSNEVNNEPLSMSMFASRKDYDVAVSKRARREKLITACSNDMENTLREDSDQRYDLARSGFKGFANMTDEELEQAYSDAGLDEMDEDEPEEIED